MLLPTGIPVRVFYAPHEDIWIKAANTLRASERQSALEDIAALSGRHLGSVVSRATYLQKLDRQTARDLLGTAFARRVMVPERSQRRSPRAR